MRCQLPLLLLLLLLLLQLLLLRNQVIKFNAHTASILTTAAPIHVPGMS